MTDDIAAELSVSVRVPFGTKEQLQTLRPLFKAKRHRARPLSSTEPWDASGLSGRQAAEKRAAWHAYREQLRQEGQLLDSLDVVVMLEARAEVRARGWEREWPALPAEALMPGRWPGARDQGFPELVSARLPAGLVHQVRQACWHTSAEAIGLLRNWRDRHPNKLPGRSVRVRSEDEALAEYERLAAQVTTTGSVWRAVIERLVDAVPVLLQRIDDASAAPAPSSRG